MDEATHKDLMKANRGIVNAEFQFKNFSGNRNRREHP